MDEKTANDRAIIPIGPRGVELTTVESMFRFAKVYLQSGLAPNSFRSEQQLVIAWAKAAELGLSPLQATDGMAIINGRVGIMGDLALAMVESSGLLAKKTVRYTGEGDNLTCELTLQRKGREEQVYTFSVREAKQAGIYDRSAVWRGYPKRMTYYRALGFGLRDEFPDVLKGTKTVEELQDYPASEPSPVIYDQDADETKIAANQAHEKELQHSGVKFVASKGVQPSAAEAAEPAFEEDKAKAPPFASRLQEDFPDMPPPPTQPEAAADLPPEASAAAQEEARVPEPPWRDYVLRSFEPKSTAYYRKKIGDLSRAQLDTVEAKWIPAIRAQWDKANPEQLADYAMLEAAIAFYKMAKPW
jgi:hypothetical protein